MTIKEVLELHKEKITCDYIGGVSSQEIADNYGCSKAYIYKFLKYHDIGLNRPSTFDIYKGRIRKLHSEGLSSYAISKKLKISGSTCDRYVHILGLDISKNSKRRDDPIINHKDEIIKLYKEGLGCYKLCKLFDCDESSITRLLTKCGVKKRPLRQISFDENFFDVINNESKAYFLGLMYADGNNSVTSACISLIDKHILEDFAKVIEYQGEIKIIEPRKETHKTQYRLNLCSTKLCKALTKQGCIKNKTFTLQFPSIDIIPNELMNHFIRGYLDGDGSISFNNGKGVVQFCGNVQLIVCMSEYLKNEIDISGSYCRASKDCDPRIYKLTIGGRHQSLKFLDWLYQDATIYLKRKYKKYKQLKDTV